MDCGSSPVDTAQSWWPRETGETHHRKESRFQKEGGVLNHRKVDKRVLHCEHFLGGFLVPPACLGVGVMSTPGLNWGLTSVIREQVQSAGFPLSVCQ